MPEMTLSAAKEVVAKAIEYEAWAWDDPANVTDEMVVQTADNLVAACRQASQGGSIADAVMEILFAASVEPLSEPSRAAYTQRFGSLPASNGNAAAAPVTSEDASAMARAAAAPTTEPQPSASSEPADSPAPAAGDISDVFPGYDDLKAADVKKAVLASAASGDLSSEEWERIKAYEAATEERKSILSLEPEFKAPEPEPVPAPTTTSGQGSFTVSGPGVLSQTYAYNQTPGEGDSVSAFYAGSEQSRAQQENLPIPGNVDFSQHPPMLPIDITTVSDQELSRVATQFHSCFARAQWLQSQEEGRERAAEHLEREAERDAYVQAYELHKNQIPEEKRTQPTALEAARKAAERDAETSQHVRDYRSRKVRHGIDARELRALAGGYDKAVWRINEELKRRAQLSTSRAS